MVTADDVLAIRKTYKPGRPTVRELAESYGVSHQTIANIVNGVAWTHLLDPDALLTPWARAAQRKAAAKRKTA